MCPYIDMKGSKSLIDSDDEDDCSDNPAKLTSTPTSSSSATASVASQSRCTRVSTMSPPEILGIQTVTNERKKSRPKAGVWVDDDRSQSEPLPPSSPHDKRPATRDLIQKHHANITKLRKSLSKDPLYDPIKHDSLWLLRFLLSHHTVAEALPAAQNFLQYRHEKKLDDSDLRLHVPSVVNPLTADFFKCFDAPDAMVYSQPDPDRGVVLYVHLADINQTKLASISDDNWPFWYFLEWMFQMLDSVTRRTGRLTKGIRFVDLERYSMAQNHRETVNRNAQNARDCQDHYPQMLASVFVVNAPSVFTVCFRIIKPLLPKRFVEKFDILPKHHTEKLLPYMSLEDIPTRYGGKNESWPPLRMRRVASKDWQATIELLKGSSRLVEV
jgi:hypothetical protein